MKRYFSIAIIALAIPFFCNGQAIKKPTTVATKTQSAPVKKIVKTNNDPKALDVLNRASATYNKSGGVKAGFSLKILDSGGIENNTIEGTIKLKGSMFKLEVKEMISWFDGKNQWVYLTSNKEVNLSNPTEEDLLMINPVNVFQLYRHGYECKYLGEKNESGKAVLKVRLTPTDKYSSLSNIDATFDKVSLRPLNIIITNKDKSGSVINITTYQSGQTYADSFFSFPQKEYPNLDVIDLR